MAEINQTIPLKERVSADPHLSLLAQKARERLAKPTLDEQILNDPNLPLLAEKARAYWESKTTTTPKTPGPRLPRIPHIPIPSKKHRTALASTAVVVSIAAMGVANRPENIKLPHFEPPKLTLPSLPSITPPELPSLKLLPNFPWPTQGVKVGEPTAAPTETAEMVTKETSSLEKLLTPFIKEALKRREDRAKNDPEYAKRVDAELNKNRLNFLFYGYGEEHAGDYVNQPTFGSHSIFSIDRKSGKLDVVSLTHDIRAPEIENYQKEKSEEPRPTRMDRAYDIGGFDLQREVLENATGLSIDFQIVLEDTFIKNAVDTLGGITVDVPFDVKTREFRDQEKLYPARHFSKGAQKMDGIAALQFIKAWSDPVDPAKERNVRKHIAMRALFDELKRKAKEKDVFFGVRAVSFFVSERLRDNMEFDFDEKEFLFPLLTNIGKMGKVDVSLDKTIFIVDPAIGDGGVQWITANEHENPITKKDIEEGRYPPDLAMEVPFNANPYAEDLIMNYWQSVRKLIRERLFF